MEILRSNKNQHKSKLKYISKAVEHQNEGHLHFRCFQCSFVRSLCPTVPEVRCGYRLNCGKDR